MKMSNQLITQQNLTNTALKFETQTPHSNANAKLTDFLLQTILCTKWQDVVSHPTEESSYYWVRLTRASLVKQLGGKFTITEVTKLIDKLADIASTLFHTTATHDLPPYESKYNKKETKDYIMFPVIAGHTNQDNLFKTFSRHDHEVKDICEEWQVGRKYNIGVKPTTTEADYYNPQLIIDTDWDELLKKRPVGRPRKPVDPFRRAEQSVKRMTMRRLAERFDKANAKLETKIDNLTKLISKNIG